MNADLSQLEVHHSLQRIVFEEVLKISPGFNNEIANDICAHIHFTGGCGCHLGLLEQRPPGTNSNANSDANSDANLRLSIDDRRRAYGISNKNEVA